MTEELRRIPAHVAEAVTTLYHAAYREVLRSTTVLAGPADAPDLVQHAFQEAALNWAEVGGRSLNGQKAWLRTVCRHKFIDGVRRDNHFGELQTLVYERYTSAPHDPADVTVARTALERCWEAIQAMPDAQRAVAVLAWHEGLDPAEIATSLGISRPGRPRAHRPGPHRSPGPSPGDLSPANHFPQFRRDGRAMDPDSGCVRTAADLRCAQPLSGGSQPWKLPGFFRHSTSEFLSI